MDYVKDKLDIVTLYSGNKTIELESSKFDLIYKAPVVNYSLLVDKEPLANEMFNFTNGGKSVLGIYKKERGKYL